MHAALSMFQVLVGKRQHTLRVSTTDHGGGYQGDGTISAEMRWQRHRETESQVLNALFAPQTKSKLLWLEGLFPHLLLLTWVSTWGLPGRSSNPKQSICVVLIAQLSDVWNFTLIHTGRRGILKFFSLVYPGPMYYIALKVEICKVLVSIHQCIHEKESVPKK
jgi:hypothetical protein